eukprot:GILI01026759.1.p1 GENE.GILI01026759.1~~GILI01026759.1.p1  ORF type:complete len:349 (+),score=37.52 GILI01026759.1:73-1119(+)
MHYQRGRRPYGNNGNLGVMLLVANVLRIGLEHIPPVTLGVVALCTALYLDLIPMARGISEMGACFNFMDLLVGGSVAAAAAATQPSLAWRFLQFAASPILNFLRFTNDVPAHTMSLRFTPSIMRRLALSNFFHASDFHLYYNMMSWLYKGRTYELVFGSEFMLLWLTCAVIGTSVMYLVVCSIIVFIIKDPSSFVGYTLGNWLEPNACVVGFSGVIFCLKTVLNFYNVQAHGELDEQIFIPFFGPIFKTPLRHAVWAELIVIQLITPHVSFIGHLSGILTGLLFSFLDLASWLRPAAEALKSFRERLVNLPNNAAPPRPQPQQANHNRPPPYQNPNYHVPRGETGGFM